MTKYGEDSLTTKAIQQADAAYVWHYDVIKYALSLGAYFDSVGDIIVTQEVLDKIQDKFFKESQC